jgi:hypothetical protein
VEVKVRISIKFIEDQFSKVVYDSLFPDNVDFPMGLTMTTEIKGKYLILSFTSSGSIETLVSTIDEVLENCQLSLHVLS